MIDDKEVNEAIKTLEKNGYWVDLEHGKIREVEGVTRIEKIECLNNDAISNKLAVLTYLKNKYKSFENAIRAGYPREAIEHATDVLSIGNNIPLGKNGRKTYVCSDIHGMYGSYCNVIRQMEKSDELFILGDVIDRGKNGIKIIQDIMKRKSPQVKLLLGNHEYMMLECLDIIRKYNLTWEEITKVNNSKKYSKKLAILELGQKEYVKEEFEQKKEEYKWFIEENRNFGNCVQLTDYEVNKIFNWIEDNHGENTLNDYMNLSEKEQEEIYSFLENCPVMGNINRDGKNYMLVHSRPLFKKEIVQKVKNRDYMYIYKDIKKAPNVLQYLLWTRDEDDTLEPYAEYAKEGFITICGHTPVEEIQIDKTRGMLRIDTGCGHTRRKNARLTLLCLENGKVHYRALKQEENDVTIER